MFWKLRLLEFFAALCVGLGGFLIGNYVTPYCRSFAWDDPTISYVYKGSTFPSSSLAVISVVPALFFVGVKFARNRDEPHFLEMCVAWVLTQSVACALAMLFVDIPKVFAGRLRPDFLSRLQRAGVNSTMIGVDYCSIKDSDVLDGRVSFPSGHSGISFAAVMTLVQFLVSEIQPFRHASFPRFLLCIIPLVLPYIVAISRTRDNVHHFADVLTGSLTGIIASVVAVKLHFYSGGLQGKLLVRLGPEFDDLGRFDSTGARLVRPTTGSNESNDSPLITLHSFAGASVRSDPMVTSATREHAQGSVDAPLTHVSI